MRFRSTLAALTALLALVATPTAAFAGSSVHVTLDAAAVRSVTVSLASLKLGSCTYGSASTGDTLAFPNGRCISPVPPVITNGGVAGHIDVATTAPTPADGGTLWAVCACTSGPPGADQIGIETTQSPGTRSFSPVVTTPRCDGAWSPTVGIQGGSPCAANPFQSATEYIQILGPASSTDPSTSWSFDVTWSAVP